jgi:hypothetical protein
MKAKELIAILSTVDGDNEVYLASDEEVNCINELYNIQYLRLNEETPSEKLPILLIPGKEIEG